MTRPRTIESKNLRRQQILAAAMDVFFEKGFTAARLDDIARKADLAKGTIYLYFDSKEELFKELIASTTGPNIETIEAIAASADSFSDTIQKFAKFAPVLIQSSDLPRLIKILIADAHAFPSTIKDYRRNVLEKVLSVIESILERARERGEIEVSDVGLAARLIIAPVALSGIWHAVFGGDQDAEIDLNALFQLHASTLLKGLKSGKLSN